MGVLSNAALLNIFEIFDNFLLENDFDEDFLMLKGEKHWNSFTLFLLINDLF